MIGTAIHAVTALLVQLAVYFLTGDPITGGLMGVAFWFGNEFAQAEYRAIGEGARRDISLLDGLNPKHWTTKSVFDVLAPLVVVYIAYRVIGEFL